MKKIKILSIGLLLTVVFVLTLTIVFKGDTVDTNNKIMGEDHPEMVLPYSVDETLEF